MSAADNDPKSSQPRHERHGAYMSWLARQRFRPHDDCNRIKAFGGLASRNAIVGGDERQRYEVGYFRHGSLLAGIGLKSPPHKGV
jgi:hypothetical protein